MVIIIDDIVSAAMVTGSLPIVLLLFCVTAFLFKLWRCIRVHLEW